MIIPPSDQTLIFFNGCKEKAPNISWFNPESYGESKTIRSLQQCPVVMKEGFNDNNKKAA